MSGEHKLYGGTWEQQTPWDEHQVRVRDRHSEEKDREGNRRAERDWESRKLHLCAPIQVIYSLCAFIAVPQIEKHHHYPCCRQAWGLCLQQVRQHQNPGASVCQPGFGSLNLVLHPRGTESSQEGAW